VPDFTSQEGAASASRVVLIVDDSRLARMVMGNALGRLRPDWAVRQAANADEALEAMEANRIDIAFIDFNMPGTDGLVLAAKLRERWPDMPLAVISANVQDDVIARARVLDASFMPKPLTDEALGAFLSGAALRLRRAPR
jgi:CheY-like chemotaxis protein